MLLGIGVSWFVFAFLQHCFAFFFCKPRLSCCRVLNSSFKNLISLLMIFNPFRYRLHSLHLLLALGHGLDDSYKGFIYFHRAQARPQAALLFLWGTQFFQFPLHGLDSFLTGPVCTVPSPCTGPSWYLLSQMGVDTPGSSSCSRVDTSLCTQH